MDILKHIKFTLLILCSITVVVVRCQDVVEQNNTKTVDLQGSEVDGTVKAALENGSVSEVIVRKDLLLFPVNAPNLVIAHSQQIHAIPQINDTNNTDGKPKAAEVAEINEYSLSQLVSTNNTDNETESKTLPIGASLLPSITQNHSILEPGKLLEIVSGFNLSDGLATEKVALPDEVQNISLPKQSIVDLLSKPLAQSNASLITTSEPSLYSVVKRSVDPLEDDDDDDDDDDSSTSDENDTDSTKPNSSSSNTTEIVKRAVDPEISEDYKSNSDDIKVKKNSTESTDNKKLSLDTSEYYDSKE